MSDYDLGLKVLKYFWNWQRAYYAQTFTLSFDQFTKTLSPTNGTKLKIYIDGIGLGARQAEMSDSDIEAAMRALSFASKGKVPSDYQIYFKYLSNEAVKVNWIDALAYTAVESVKDVAKGAQEVGDSLIITGKIINYLLPGIALIFLFYWMNKKTEGGLASAAKSFRK